LRPASEIPAEIAEALRIGFENTTATTTKGIDWALLIAAAAVLVIYQEIGACVATMIGIVAADRITTTRDTNTDTLISGTWNTHALEIALSAVEDIHRRVYTCRSTKRQPVLAATNASLSFTTGMTAP